MVMPFLSFRYPVLNMMISVCPLTDIFCAYYRGASQRYKTVHGNFARPILEILTILKVLRRQPEGVLSYGRTTKS